MDGKEKWRNWALIGRERHTHAAQEGSLPYPTRVLRTPDHLYVINFKPERWPIGQPNEITHNFTPAFDALADDTYLGFADRDEYAGIRKQLHEQLMGELTKNQAPRLADAFDRPPYLVTGKGARR
jgi:hypothetical protein